jgi:hypothetical protein
VARNPCLEVRLCSNSVLLNLSHIRTTMLRYDLYAVALCSNIVVRAHLVCVRARACMWGVCACVRACGVRVYIYIYVYIY